MAAAVARHSQPHCNLIQPQCRFRTTVASPVEQPSSRMATDAGEKLGAGDVAGPDIGVEVSDRWHAGEYGDHDDR